MLYQGTLLAVRDMALSLQFYREVLGCEILQDFGANVSLTGGIFLQTLDTWAGFLRRKPQEIAFGGADAELYFEEADMDSFAALLAAHPEIRLLHPIQEHAWGQRALRLFDPDGHVIEVGEPLWAVARRFSEKGMTAEEIARRMDIPRELALRLLSGRPEPDSSKNRKKAF